jgi:2,3-bisphosphoglycerate-independent phosphoglycerate mutase
MDEKGIVLDRRAGRIREGTEALARAMDKLALPGEFSGVTVRVKPATEHRLAIVLSGKGLSPAIHGSDPGEGATPGAPLVPRPMDFADDKAVYTAAALECFEQEARKLLADQPVNREREKRGFPVANTILTRGAGRIHTLLPLEESGVPLQLACVGGDRTVLGLARLLGAGTRSTEEMTANLDTDLEVKFAAAEQALSHNNLVMVHVKGADIAAHDRRPDLKAQFLEKIDAGLAKLLEMHDGPLRLVIASDHATLSESGTHAADPVPVVIWGNGVEPDDVEAYDEQSVSSGGLQRFPLQQLLGHLFRLA